MNPNPNPNPNHGNGVSAHKCEEAVITKLGVSG